MHIRLQREKKWLAPKRPPEPGGSFSCRGKTSRPTVQLEPRQDSDPLDASNVLMCLSVASRTDDKTFLPATCRPHRLIRVRSKCRKIDSSEAETLLSLCGLETCQTRWYPSRPTSRLYQFPPPESCPWSTISNGVTRTAVGDSL
jgi:hypothetical protein